MPDDDVIRLDVLVDDADNLVAIMNRLKHVNQVEPALPGRDALGDHRVGVSAKPALFVVCCMVLVQGTNHLSQAAALVVLRH